MAKRLAFSSQQSFSRFIIRLSAGATAVGVAAMIITLCFVNGFQQKVSDKIYSFWGHIRVQHFEPDKSMVAEEIAITNDDAIKMQLLIDPSVSKVQAFATKSAVIEKNKNIEGILLKGIEAEYDSSKLNPYLTAGRWLHFNDSLYSKEIIISQPLADLLLIQLNDTVQLYFVGQADNSRTYRKLRVVGLYKTGIEEYDKLFVIGDLKLIQRINNWNQDQIGGYELFLKDYKNADTVNTLLSDALPTQWMSRTVASIYPNIFDWLNIQDVNRNVIFIIMAIVAIINLITCLLILILERTRMIGLLNALGANHKNIMKIFLYYGAAIAGAGVTIGFILGIGICLLQQYTGFIQLDELSYSVSTAPVKIIWWQIGAVCTSTLVICYLILIIPALIIRKINPITAIQFR